MPNQRQQTIDLRLRRPRLLVFPTCRSSSQPNRSNNGAKSHYEQISHVMAACLVRVAAARVVYTLL